MTILSAQDHVQTIAKEWVTFPGGELEGTRPKALCPSCRETLKREAAGNRPVGPARPTLCFQCYRADLDREQALRYLMSNFLPGQTIAVAYAADRTQQFAAK